MDDSSAPYPAHREVDVVLRDGATVRIRPARREDRERIEDYLIGLSDESRYFRFGGVAVDVSDIARRSTEVDYRNHLTLLAVAEAGAGEVIGGAQYIREGDPSRAEVSVSVADALQGRGLGSILVAHLADAADDAGISTFHAQVLPENHRMVDVFRRSGFPRSIRARRRGPWRSSSRSALTAEALAAFEDRDRIARRTPSDAIPPARVRRGDRRVARPSRRSAAAPPQPARRPLPGPRLPGQPEGAVVQGVAAYPTCSTSPAPSTSRSSRCRRRTSSRSPGECGEKGVRGLVVISAGFAETGVGRRRAQARAARRVPRVRHAAGRPQLHGDREHRPRRADERDLRAGRARRRARRVPLAERRARHRDPGARGRARPRALDVRVASGTRPTSRATTSSSTGRTIRDTDVILLYLESFGNPRQFARLARRVGAAQADRRREERAHAQPAPRAARVAHRRAARRLRRHRGRALPAERRDPHRHARGAVRRGRRCSPTSRSRRAPRRDRHQRRRPRDPRADACEANGLVCRSCGADTVHALRGSSPPRRRSTNPVDMIASASAEDYGRAIRWSRVIQGSTR